MDLYGIPNCNTVKKARDFLTNNGIEYTFHDYKKEPPTEALLAEWLEQVAWGILINRKGMTWRNLSDIEKAVINNDRTATQLMITKPSIIKRPVLIKDGTILQVGFDINAYEAIFSE